MKVLGVCAETPVMNSGIPEQAASQQGQGRERLWTTGLSHMKGIKWLIGVILEPVFAVGDGGGGALFAAGSL